MNLEHFQQWQAQSKDFTPRDAVKVLYALHTCQLAERVA